MITFSPEQSALISGGIGFFFTVAILSYAIGDNFLYRIALHIFTGVAVGYAGLVAIYQVLIPRLIVPLSSGNTTVIALMTVPLVLFIFLVLKLSPRTASFGNISIAYLMGVGVAVSVGGALTGTLLPQIQTTWLSLLPAGDGLQFLNHFIVLIGTITTLLYFQFWLRGQTPSGSPGRVPAMKIVNMIGQGFLVVTLGAIYGGLILSGFAVLSERLLTISGWLATLIS